MEHGLTKKDLTDALGVMETQLHADVSDALKASEERTAALIAGEVGNLHTQIQQSEARLGAKLDEMNTRLDVHARYLLTGARQIAGVIRFTEASGKHWRALDKRMDAVEKKLGRKASR